MTFCLYICWSLKVGLDCVEYDTTAQGCGVPSGRSCFATLGSHCPEQSEYEHVRMQLYDEHF